MIDFHKWPKGLNTKLAVFDFSISEASRKFDVEFFESFDDLDYFQYAIVEFDDNIFALIRYRGAPLPGITLEGWEGMPKQVQLQLFMTRFSINSDRVLWVAET